jgi:cobalt-zinc-cadmium efflux system outer membrane protein
MATKPVGGSAVDSRGTAPFFLKKPIVCVLLALFVIGGCTTYRPMPITSKTVHARLLPPDMEDVRVRASSIKHPLFKAVPFDDRDGLSPDEAAVLAVVVAPSLRAVRDQRALAGAQLLEARLLPNPELCYAFEVPTGGDTAGTVNGFGFELGWDVTSLISRSARMNQAEAHRASVELDIAWKEWQVALAAKSAVYQLAALQSQISLAEETAQYLDQNLNLVRKAAASGTKTAEDLSAAQMASRRANAALLDLRKQASERRLELNLLLGLPPEFSVRLEDGIEFRSRFELPAEGELLDGLERRRLDLVALRCGYDSQEAAVRAAVLDQFPKIKIGPTVGRDTENVNTAGFGLSIELPVFNDSRVRIAIERATRQRLFDEYIGRVFEAQSDIRMIESQIRFLNQETAAAQEAEPELQKLVENYRAAVGAGRADALTYYAAWNELTGNRMKVLVLKGQLAEAAVALELATGIYGIALPNRTSTTRPAGHEEVLP